MIDGPSPNEFKSMVLDAACTLIIDMESQTVVFATWRAEAMLGYIRGELVGQPLEILIPEAKRKIHLRHIMEFMKNPRERAMGLGGYDLEARKKDGTSNGVTIELVPEFWNGAIRRMFVTANILLTAEDGVVHVE